MNFDKIDLYIENIVPGVSIVSLIVYMMGIASDKTIVDYAMYIMPSFIAISYLLGAVANIFSRMLVDTACKRYVRIRAFNYFLAEKIKEFKADGGKLDLNSLYSKSIDQAMVCKSKEVVAEVVRRRQAGRLVRSALIPGSLVLFAICLKFEPSIRSMIIGVPAIIAYVAVIIIIYGFGECTVFQEALRGARIGPDAGAEKVGEEKK